MINIDEIEDLKLKEKAKHWLAIFEDWQKSRLSKTQYYKLNNIPPSNAYHWFKYLQGQTLFPYARKKPIRKIKKSSPLKFIALERPTNTDGVPRKEAQGPVSGLKIIFSKGLFLSIEKDFDATSLNRVLHILENRCS